MVKKILKFIMIFVLMVSTVLTCTQKTEAASMTVVKSGTVENFMKDLPLASAYCDYTKVAVVKNWKFTTTNSNIKFNSNGIATGGLPCYIYYNGALNSGTTSIGEYSVTYPDAIVLSDGTRADLKVTWTNNVLYSSQAKSGQFMLGVNNVINQEAGWINDNGVTGARSCDITLQILKGNTKVTGCTLLTAAKDLDIAGINGTYDISTDKYLESFRIDSGLKSTVYVTSNTLLKWQNNKFYGTKADDNTFNSGFACLSDVDTFKWHWEGSKCGTGLLLYNNGLEHKVTAEVIGSWKQGGKVETTGTGLTVSTNNSNNSSLIVVPHLSNAKCTITTNTGYQLLKVIVDNSNVGIDKLSKNNDGTFFYNFNNITADHDIKVQYRKIVVYGGFTFTKTSNGNGQALQNAQYVVKNSSGAYLKANSATAEPTYTTNLSEAKQFTTNNLGKFTVDYIPAGTYQIIETKAPTGYKLDTTPISVTVNVDSNGVPTYSTGTATNNKKLMYQNDTYVGYYDSTSITKYTAGQKDEPNPVSLTFNSNKILEEGTLKADDFEFEIVPTNTVASDPVTKEGIKVKNDANGNINFGTYQYTRAGTYVYNVKETDGGNLGTSVDVLKDKEVRKLTVVIEEATSGLVVKSVKLGDKELTGSSGQYNVTTFKNKIIKGSITVKKENDFGNPLEGVTFKLEKKVNDEWVNLGEKETDKDGKLVFSELYKGEYRLTETKTVNNMTLLKDSIAVTLPYQTDTGDALTTGNPTYSEDGKDYYMDLTYTVRNGQVLDSPESGGNGRMLCFLSGGLMIFTALAYMIKKYQLSLKK